LTFCLEIFFILRNIIETPCLSKSYEYLDREVKVKKDGIIYDVKIEINSVLEFRLFIIFIA